MIFFLVRIVGSKWHWVFVIVGGFFFRIRCGFFSFRFDRSLQPPYIAKSSVEHVADLC
jgi:hypothetical protein